MSGKTLARIGVGHGLDCGARLDGAKLGVGQVEGGAHFAQIEQADDDSPGREQFAFFVRHFGHPGVAWGAQLALRGQQAPAL